MHFEDSSSTGWDSLSSCLMCHAGFRLECAAFVARNLQDMTPDQLPGGHDPQLTSVLEQFMRAYTFSKASGTSAASWKGVS